MNSPTIDDQASITSLSRNRSFRPSFCISFGSNTPGVSHLSGRSFFSGKPRHSWMTAVRREGFTVRNGVLEYWSNDDEEMARLHQHSITPPLQPLVLPPHVPRQNVKLGAI